MRVGALEAHRWAGLVFAAGPDDGIGLRLVFTTPDGQRCELEDWYWNGLPGRSPRAGRQLRAH